MLCDFFRDSYDSTNLRKRKLEKTPGSRNKLVKKISKSKIQKDEQGNIAYPIKISGSLTLIHPGVVNPLPAYHSAHNIFPVGFVSERLYASIYDKSKKALYRCEILDGGDKPIFKVTCSEDPNNPIIKDTSTGCWVHICKLVDNLADTQKEKVTISGTERFGLKEQTVSHILEFLPGAEQCIGHSFRHLEKGPI